MVCLVSPPFVVAFIPVVFCYKLAFQYYQPSARDSNRLLSINTSPLISHFSETLNVSANSSPPK